MKQKENKAEELGRRQVKQHYQNRTDPSRCTGICKDEAKRTTSCGAHVSPSASQDAVLK